ncbi:beta-lactamase family protein [Sphingomonas sp. LB-2]|uniref:serine hydrolase domain-containing protein n=1 Tax=Sphingomonas caeni TaxID=2984949 RepID=UPI002231FFB0|nr:serine hydrolase domain-containing protein [Sphingomonas caeni]MCW3846446.1 beta-lactamase family protein [Sphingomonas caeni]
MRIGRRQVLAGLPLACIAASGSAFRDAVAPLAEAAAKQYFADAPGAAGLSVGVVHGSATYRGTFGSLMRGAGVKPRADTIFPMASISKTFTAALLGQAVQAGKVALADDVRRFLDGDYPNLVFEGQPVLLWHLLNHNSGLPFNLPDIAENRPPFPEASPEVKQRLAAYGRVDFFRDLHGVTLLRAPGTGFSYSNAAALLLSYVLERVLGQPFEALARTRIAAPLGMRDTLIVPDAARAARLARGYDESERLVSADNAALLGAAAIKSTIGDMIRYLRWQMAETSPEVRLSHAPHPIDGKFAVGLNWQMMIDGPRRRIWQDGTMPGFAAMCMFLPHAEAGVVAFANQLDRRSMGAFHAMTRQILVGLDPGSADLF